MSKVVRGGGIRTFGVRNMRQTCNLWDVTKFLTGETGKISAMVISPGCDHASCSSRLAQLSCLLREGIRMYAKVKQRRT